MTKMKETTTTELDNNANSDRCTHRTALSCSFSTDVGNAAGHCVPCMEDGTHRGTALSCGFRADVGTTDDGGYQRTTTTVCSSALMAEEAQAGIHTVTKEQKFGEKNPPSWTVELVATLPTPATSEVTR